MTYPNTWAALREAAATWSPPIEHSEAFAEISATPIEYKFCTRAFDLLGPIVDSLDDAGAKIALGAAHRINEVQFDGRHGEALAFLIANAHRAGSPA